MESEVEIKSLQNTDFHTLSKAFSGAFAENVLVGYCIFEPTSGDVTQLAVAPTHRRKGIGTALLRKALSKNKYSSLKVLNTDTVCTSMTGFLKARNVELKGKQDEMIKAL